MADDGRGDDAAVGRIAGAWIDDVVIGRAVLLKIPLIAARGDDGLVLNLNDGEVFLAVLWVLPSDLRPSACTLPPSEMMPLVTPFSLNICIIRSYV